MSDLRLDLGSLDLVGADGGGDAYWFEVLADGFSSGSPGAAKAVVASLMRDGENSRITSFGNRVMTFQVAVRSPDSAGLNEGERALWLALSQPTTLTWRHPDGFATSVYDVLNGTMTPIVDDLGWARRPLEQVYAIELECLPWARPAEKTTVTFTPGTASTATVDDASALTNWSANPPAYSAGRDGVSYTGATLTTTTHLSEAAVSVNGAAVADNTPTAVPVFWAGTHPVSTFVAIDVHPDAGSFIGLVSGGFIGGGGNAVTLNDTPAIAVELRDSGFTRYYFKNPGGSGSWTFTVFGGTFVGTGGTGLDFFVGGLYSMATVPTTGVLLAEIDGSVRTNGSLRLSRAAVDLSVVMVYTDPTMLTHGWNPGAPATFPLAPAGRYAVYVQNTSISAGSGSVIQATVTGPAGVPQTIRTRYDGAASWIPVGVVELGGSRDNRLGSLTWSWVVDGVGDPSANIRLFRIADPASDPYGPTSFTHINPGAGVGEIIIDVPSLEYPEGGVWAEGADAMDVVDAWEHPLVAPPMAAIWAADAGSTSGISGRDLTVEFSYYPLFHTYVAAVS